MSLNNVAFVFPKFPVKSETFACLDVKSLLNNGVNIDVYSLRSSDDDKDSVLKERELENLFVCESGFINSFLAALRFINVFFYLIYISVTHEKSLKNVLRVIYHIPSSIYIWSKIKTNNYQCVHLFWGHTPSLVGLLICRYSPQINYTMFLGAYDLYLRMGISKLACNNAKIIFTHAKCNINTITENNDVEDEKVKVIYRGIDVRKVEDYQSDKIASSWVLSSRLIPSKRVDLAINHFKSVVNSDSSSTLHIFGDGSERAKLERLVSDLDITEHVKFYGHVSQERMFETMAQCEFALLLSQKTGECLPNAIKEAMSFQCKVLVSNTPGIKELIPNSLLGVVVEGDFDKLSPCMLSEVSPKLAKQHIHNHFNSDNSTKSYIECWKQLL
ncbi:putative Glycos_transf_1 domain-containing protein [Vibrio chagasii]|nr:putative Glycos_transf_1 domain-containing protein [Vibrio chagasii]CAH6955028.1 putative Glycos_transf_1 domain-containing protein [Vibrio chagasii]CAH6955262.1 putative Glycos_transf_1 domain-containing protein [Vibrio chagasii]CAH7116577.1 putative Glycos_transf_1 domain-containing protein [Vibrio chagasii]CAH7351024.1 putative Glycos_transf_1 domain-containing protein [Vibrio chagasii]